MTLTRELVSLQNCHDIQRGGAGQPVRLFASTSLELGGYMSYDEMPLAALLGVAAPSFFINAGPRDNRAQPAPPGTFAPRGVMVGLVGARFERLELTAAFD